MLMEFNKVVLTEETLLKTDQYFADLHQQCIDGAKNGDFYVNDIDRYVEDENKRKQMHINCECRHTFTYLQKAHFIQTGESIPLLPQKSYKQYEKFN